MGMWAGSGAPPNTHRAIEVLGGWSRDHPWRYTGAIVTCAVVAVAARTGSIVASLGVTVSLAMCLGVNQTALRQKPLQAPGYFLALFCLAVLGLEMLMLYGPTDTRSIVLFIVVPALVLALLGGWEILKGRRARS